MLQIAHQARPGNDDQQHQNPDKFSEVTPLVFYHILSFLGVNDLARLCLVSTRCRERCVSSPDILFDVNLDEESCTSKCRGLRNLLEKLLEVRDDKFGLLPMRRFRLHWHCLECKDFSPPSVFHRWLERAVSCNAEEIDIGFFPDELVGFVLPNCLGRVSSATILRLNLWGGQLNCSPKEDFASIQVLGLSSMWVASGCHLGQWISSRFASLKTLKLEKIRFHQDFSITSSSLQCLAFSDCLLGPGARVPFYACSIECTRLRSLLLNNCRFKSLGLFITCPSLEDLQITKCSTETLICSSISAEALRTLSIDMILRDLTRVFQIRPRRLRSLERATIKLGPEMRADWGIKIGLLQFLRGINYTYVLEIDTGTIRILDIEEVEVAFHNLHHLEITIDNLQDLNETSIATFISVMCSVSSVGLMTVTLKYDECQHDPVHSYVVRLRREIPASVEITWLK